MAAGSIVIDLLMKTGSFETDTKRAEKRLKDLEKQVKASAAAFGTALVAGSVAAFAAIDQLAKGASDFKDLEETTGASAEGLASLAVAAGTAGLSMQDIGASAIKLTQNLVGVDDESKAAGAAIKALGLDLDEFKRLDSVERVDALTKAFAGLKDGNEKTALAVALFGKTGAEQLKLFKALEEQGGRTIILTQAQIELADAYADAQAKTTTELKLYAQAAATEALPAFAALTAAGKQFVGELIGIDKETGRLAANSGVRDFAEGAVQVLGFAVDAADGVVRAFQIVGNVLAVNAAIVAAVVSGEIRQAIAIAAEGRAEIDRILNRDLFSDRLSRALSDVRKVQPKGPDNRPTANFPGAVRPASAISKAKEEVDKVAKAIADLERELALFGQDEAFTKAFALEGIGASTAQVDAYRASLQKLAELKVDEDIAKTIAALVEQRDTLGMTSGELEIHKLVLMGASQAQIEFAQSVVKTTEAERAHKDVMEEGKRVTEEFRTPLEVLLARYEELNKLLSANAIGQQTYARAVQDAQDTFAKATTPVEEKLKETKSIAEDLGLTFSSAFEDAIVGGKNFRDVLSGIEQDILRIVTRKMVTEPFTEFITNSLKGFGSSTGLGSLFSGIGSFFGGLFADGGSPPLGKVSIVGERGPEFFVPRTAGTILPMDKVPTTRSTQQSVTQHFHITGAVDKRTQQQVFAEAGRGVMRANARRTA